jgi:hypothetical protein
MTGKHFGYCKRGQVLALLSRCADPEPAPDDPPTYRCSDGTLIWTGPEPAPDADALVERIDAVIAFAAPAEHELTPLSQRMLSLLRDLRAHLLAAPVAQEEPITASPATAPRSELDYIPRYPQGDGDEREIS